VEAVEIWQGQGTRKYPIKSKFLSAVSSLLVCLANASLTFLLDIPVDYRELFQYYTLEKGNRNEISIYFVNADNFHPRDAAKVNSEWTDDNKWRGAGSGWAGGADVVPAFIARARQSAPGFNPRRPVTAPPGSRDSSGKPAPLKSIMKQKAFPRPPKPGKVTFRTSLTIRSFDKAKTRLTGGLLKEETFPVSFPTNVSADTAIAKAASVAIKSGNCKDLIRHLQSGRFRTDQKLDGKRFLEEHYKMAKSLERSAARDASGMSRRLIVNILKVYRTAADAIRLAQSAKRLHKFQIRIEKISGLNRTQEGQQHDGLTSVKCGVFLTQSGKPKKLPSTPTMDFSDDIDYGSGNAAVPTYTMRVDISDPGELIVNLCSSREHMSGLPRLVLPIHTIHNYCSQTNKTVPIPKPFLAETGRFIQAGARVHLSIQKLEVEPEYLQKKEQEGCDKVQEVIHWIQQFNSEMVRAEGAASPRLKAQICGKNGYSLLHAAISFAMPELVKELVRLGADGTIQSPAGTAILHARQLDYTCRNRLLHDYHDHDKKETDFNPEVVSQKEALRDQRYKRANNFSDIVRFLGATSSVSNVVPGIGSPSIFPPRRSSLGDNVGLQCSWSDSATDRLNAALSPHSEDRLPSKEDNQLGSRDAKDLHLFLQCLVPPGDDSDDEEEDGWLNMCQLMKAFFDKHQENDAPLFRSLRALATSHNYVEWGCNDDDVCGAIKVSSPGVFDEEAAEASLRLTDAGRKALSNNPPLPAPTPAAVVTQLLSSAANASTAETLPGPTRGLHLFLQSLVPPGDDSDDEEEDGWVNMCQLMKTFFDKHQENDAPLFRSLRALATSHNYVEWGCNDDDVCGAIKVSSPGVFDEEAAEASLRLTDAGRKALSNPPLPATTNATSVVRTPSAANVSGVKTVTASATYGSQNAEQMPNSQASVLPPQGQNKCHDVKSFLQCIVRIQTDDNAWVNFEQLAAAFANEFGAEGDSMAHSVALEMRKWCEEATGKNLLVWGLPDDTGGSRVRVCPTPALVWDHAEESFVRPTEEGRTLALKRDLWLQKIQHGIARAASMEDNASSNMSLASEPSHGSRGRRNSSVSLSGPYGSAGTRGGTANRSDCDYYGPASTTATTVQQQQEHLRHPRQFWFLLTSGKGKSICHRFRSAADVGCRFGKKCHFAHINPPLGREVLESWMATRRDPLPNLPRNGFKFDVQNRSGSTFFAAAYFDANSRIYYAAEEGRCSHRDMDGTYWYACESDAEDAVAVVYAASQP